LTAPDLPAHDAELLQLQDRVRGARADKTALDIRGGGSKRWYGGTPRGTALDVTPLAGISSYEPTELVVSARAGTRLSELEAVLAEAGQCLAFEPPRFGGGGTVGGMVAAGLSGPARASAGSLRDSLLGASLINGRGELMHFGGQVMKNVAGYDVARLLAGSMGVLGIICEVSLKVLSTPPARCTLRFEMDEANALRRLNEWGGQPLPLSASAWWEGTLVLRLAGATAAVQAAQHKLGGEVIAPALADTFWAGLRDQSDEFFAGASAAVARGATLWRLSVPQTAPALKLSGEHLSEWHGGQRWLCTTAAPALVREAAAAAGGHATLFRGADKSGGVFAPLKSPLDRIQRQLKVAFDPDAIFNPGRLYPDW
jgi:glycolate oxidase FAD binding subunit